nr:hypothetical protein [Mesorhizobium shangrilense]
MRPARLLPVFLIVAMAILSACSTTDVLEPSAIAPEGQAAAASGAQTAAQDLGAASAPSNSSQTSSTQTAALPAVTRLQFAPIVGASVEAAGPLSERLAQRARQKGITIARADETTSHILKGYLSALPEGRQTTIVYVWDVLDPSGNRLHRIQGQQTVSGGDGWQSVTPATMQEIADETMEKLGVWMGGRAG